MVLAVPMTTRHSSALKATSTRGRGRPTFRYTAKGPRGAQGQEGDRLRDARRLYAGTARDTQTPYLREFLAFVGITDVEFVYAEGLAMGESSRDAALAQAERAIERLAQPVLAEAA